MEMSTNKKQLIFEEQQICFNFWNLKEEKKVLKLTGSQNMWRPAKKNPETVFRLLRNVAWNFIIIVI